MKAKDNPFRVECVQTLRLRPVGWSWDELESRLSAASYRGAIVGPEGAGKTTLLDELQSRLAANGHGVARITLRTDSRNLPPDWPSVFAVRANQILLLDGAEQMGDARWRQFLREARSLGGLVVTSHRAGLLPTLVECSTDESLLHELLERLLPPAELERLVPLAKELFMRHGGNLRLVFRDLYDYFATT